MAFIEELFLSRILDKKVVDRKGKPVGKLGDLVADLSGDFPQVIGIEVADKQSGTRLIPIEEIQAWIRQYVALDCTRRETRELPPGDYIHLRRDLLDQQIVDLNGRKVVRVNDLKLATIRGNLCLVAVDIGFRGALRRLGLRKLVHLWERRFPNVPNALIKWQDVARISAEGQGIHLGLPYEKMSKLHPADLADILEDLNREDRQSILSAIDPDLAAETLEEMEPEMQAAVVEEMEGKKASDLLGAISSDVAADILGELSPDKAEELLGLMEEEDAKEVKELLGYEEDTAGGLMSKEFLAFSEDETAEDVLQKLRVLQPDAESIYYLYVTNQEGRLSGVISLRDLVVSDPKTPIGEVMNTHVFSVEADEDQEDVAEKMTKYTLMALPVVDKSGRLVGVISINDVVDAVYLEKVRKRMERPF
jgi:magnesium transporter